MTPAPADVLILGAGPAGLGAALAVGARARVLERSADAGGLCRSLTLDGAIFDLGGHSFHSPRAEVRELVFSALPMEEQPRQAQCWVDGDWIPYPFQKYFERLSDTAAVADCVQGLTGVHAPPPEADFDTYLEARFGRGIADRFLRPYNRKLWARDLRTMASDWGGERVAAARADEGPSAGAAAHRAPLQDDSRVAYPSHGAFGAIFEALARRVDDLRYGEEVTAIDAVARTATTRSGHAHAWSRLVATLPLPALLGLVRDAPDALRDDAARLAALPIRLVLLALREPLETRVQRIYRADAAFPGHKIVLNHQSSNWLRTRTRHGIQVEVSGDRAAGGLDDEALAQRVIAGLAGMRLIPAPGAILAMRVVTVPLGYPVPTHDRAAVVSRVHAWLASRRIHCVGRFAEWAYINSDEALWRGLQLGRGLPA